MGAASARQDAAQENNGTTTPGIIPIDQEGGQEFLGSAAMAALSSIIIRDTHSRCTLHKLNADLFRVDLAPTKLQVLAVVLTGAAWAREAELSTIDYHVTVLNGLSDRPNRFTAPILSNTPDWNGTYGAIGASPVLRGRPREKLP
jgi:hypothetical protein